jgi:hypothetical protein
MPAVEVTRLLRQVAQSSALQIGAVHGAHSCYDLIAAAMAEQG